MVFGIFSKAVEKLKKGLSKTRSIFTSKLKSLFTIGRKIDQDFLDELEETMICADMGVQPTMTIIDMLKTAYKNKEIENASDVLDYLKKQLKKQLAQSGNQICYSDIPPTVILIAGVNGSGKTTSVGKLVKFIQDSGKKVIVCASDTFRAAAIEQLEIWADRCGCEMIKHKMGADPDAVAFDAVEAAIARKAAVLIIDTAGRLHTKTNLMQELTKIKRVIQKKIPNAPHETLLILDATTGQNAINQAKTFKEAIDITGLFLSKLDGTAKGGIVVAIHDQLGIPVKFIGVGEQLEDIELFSPEAFVEALLS
ncbi:MAG: signal recognition particle-docking protein FtsY [Planctomycetota bacterium]